MNKYDNESPAAINRWLPACLHACMSTCLPACLPACLHVCLAINALGSSFFLRRMHDSVSPRLALCATAACCLPASVGCIHTIGSTGSRGHQAGGGTFVTCPGYSQLSRASSTHSPHVHQSELSRLGSLTAPCLNIGPSLYMLPHRAHNNGPLNAANDEAAHGSMSMTRTRMAGEERRRDGQAGPWDGQAGGRRQPS